MTPRFEEPLAAKTTLGIGGSARIFFTATSDDEVAAAAAYAREQRLPLRVLGAGSNLLVPDEGINAVVVALAPQRASFSEDADGTRVTAGAGVRWDALVDAAGVRNLFGIETLAGIPGTVGGAAVQNIGAYGGALSDVFAYADVYNLETRAVERITRNGADFSYRSSVFKRRRELVVLRVALRLLKAGKSRLEYPDLVRYEREHGALETPARISVAVRAIRAAKFPDLSREGTAGSFFANPILKKNDAEALVARFPGLPLFPLPEAPGSVKIPLAWILEHVLELKGFTHGAVRLYEKHALVLVAERGATAREIGAFADDVAQRVRDATGIIVTREVETFRV